MISPIMKRFALFACFALTVFPAAGQSILAFAPWEFDAALSSEAKQEWTEIIFSAKRAVPLGTLLPQVTGDSYLHTLGLGMGTRFFDSEYDQVRFRVTGLDLAMQRTYSSGSFMVLDHNQTGLMDRKTTWIGAGYGPGLHVENTTRSAWLRITASGQWATIKSGGFLFPNDPTAKQTTSGLAYQLGARAGLELNHSLMLGAAFEWDEMPKADFIRKQWSINAAYPLSLQILATAGYISAQFESGTGTRSIIGWRGAIRFTPAASGF